MTIINNPAIPKALLIGAPNLVKHMQMPSLVRHYTMLMDDSVKRGISFGSIQVDQNNKYLKKQFIEDVEGIVTYCETYGIKTIGCTTPKFWQFATGDKQFMANIGKALQGVGALEGIVIVPILNYFMLLSKPEVQPDLELGVYTFNDVLLGDYDFNEVNLVEKVKKTLITTHKDAVVILNILKGSSHVTMDIETTGLTMGKDRIITLALTDSTEYGYAFALCPEYSSEYEKIRKELASWFKAYKGKHIWHNAMFDVPFIMHGIMKIPFTNQKLINKIINNMDIIDTMHITYLCRNSTSRMGNGLKELIYSKYGSTMKELTKKG